MDRNAQVGCLGIDLVLPCILAAIRVTTSRLG